MSANPIAVLILGATGITGGSIVNGLVEDGGYKVCAGVRPASMEKPPALELKKKGVELRSLDLDDLSETSLKAALDGIQVVVSAIHATQIKMQYPIIDAAKKAGVVRFIPCDFGTAGRRGVRDMLDTKLKVRDYIKEIGLGHTFVDVGWWTQFLFPALKKSQELYDFPPEFTAYLNGTYGNGTTKTAITDKDDIGRFVARILRDPRTLNKYVFCWNEETTVNEYVALVDEVTNGQVKLTHVSEEDLKKRIEKLKAEGDVTYNFWEYMISLWILGENVVSNAVKPEYGSALDARQLYPDFKPRLIPPSLEDALLTSQQLAAVYRSFLSESLLSTPPLTPALGDLITLFLTAIALGISLSAVHAVPSVTDPCVNIAGKAFVSPADARACLSSFPLNETIKRNVLDVHQKVLNFYTFEDYALNSPPPFQESTVNLRAELARISLTHYGNDYMFNMDLYNVLLRLNDGHTRWFPLCYTKIWQNVLPAPVVTLADQHGVQSVYIAPDSVAFITQFGTDFTDFYASIGLNWQRLAGARVVNIEGIPAYDYVDKIASTVSGNFLDHGIRVNSIFSSYDIVGTPGVLGQKLGTLADSPVLDLDTLEMDLIVVGGTRLEKVVIPYRAAYTGPSFTDGPSYWAANCAVQPTTNGVNLNTDTVEVRIQGRTTSLRTRPPAVASLDTSGGASPNVTLPPEFLPDVPIIAGGEGVVQSYILPGNKTGVIFVGSFATDATLPNLGWTQFETDILNSVKAFKAARVQNVLFDLHNNPGGFLCLGLFLHQFFAGLNFGFPGFQTVQRANELAIKIVNANIELGLNNTNYSPLNYAFLNDTVFQITHNYDQPIVPQLINGRSKPTSQRFHDTCPPYAVPMPSTPPFPFTNIAIIGNGICASTCALFSTAMVELHGVKTLMFGAKPGEPMEYKALAGNQVLEWADLDSEVKTALLKDDPLAPPDLLINGNLRHNWRIAYSFRDEKIPIAYESEPAQFRFPYTNETYNQPQKLWEFAASKLF